MNVRQALAAIGVTPWIPLDSQLNPFSVALNVEFDDAATGVTYQVEHTLDDLGKKLNVDSITRSGTTVTVVFRDPHGMKVNDTIIVEGAQLGGQVGLDGTFPVASITNPTTLTYTSGTSGAAVGSPSTKATLLRVFVHEFLVAKNAQDDGNYNFPVTATRLRVSAIGAGRVTMHVVQGIGPQ